LGLQEACRIQPALVGGINVMNGKVTHKAVADAHGLKWEAPALA
jgi:alanine dehydrogenase